MAYSEIEIDQVLDYLERLFNEKVNVNVQAYKERGTPPPQGFHTTLGPFVAKRVILQQRNDIVELKKTVAGLQATIADYIAQLNEPREAPAPAAPPKTHLPKRRKKEVVENKTEEEHGKDSQAE